MTRAALCNIEEIPDGQTIGEINPAFSGLKGEVRIGKPNLHCVSCRKPFNAVRKPRKEIKLYPAELHIPICCSYRICGACLAMYQSGGESKSAVLAAIESFHLDETPSE